MAIHILLLAVVGLCCKTTSGLLVVVQTLDFQINSSYNKSDVQDYFTTLLYWRADDTYIVTTEARYQLLYDTIQITDGNGPHCLNVSRSGAVYTECFWLGTEKYKWANAKAACDSSSGVLATIEDDETMQWLGGKFPQLKSSTPYWIRNSISANRNYIWLGHGRGVASWTAWAPGEPGLLHNRIEMKALQFYAQSKEAENPYVCFNTTDQYCNTAPVFSFAETTQNSSTVIRLGDSVTYKCKDLTDTIGGKPGVTNITLVCDVDPDMVVMARLSPSTFTCEEPNCGFPPEFRGAELVDGNLMLTKVLVGNSISYNCKPGYINKKAVTPSATCGLDGTWTNDTSVCEAQYRCLEPPQLTGATHTYDTLDLYGVATYTCGHTQVFKYSRTQQLNTTCRIDTSNTGAFTNGPMTAGWDSLTDECEDILCGAPPAVTGASLSSATPGPVGSSRNYHCPTGQSFPSGGTTWTVTCSDKGEWTPAPPAQCEEVRCGTPPHVWQSVYPLEDVMRRDVTFGQSVYYQCQPNYAFTNDVTAKVNKTLTCELGGWSERHPGTCEKISCGKPELSRDHILSYSTSTIGAKAVYTCAFDGYVFDGGKETWESECKLKADSASQGTWTDVPYSCNPVDCLSDGPLPHSGSLLETPASHRMGAHTTYSCHGNGYFLYGGRARTVTCNGDGIWGTIPEGLGCQERLCSTPPNVTEADIVSVSGQMVGSVTSYKCRPGTRYNTGLTHFSLTCLSSGFWRNPGGGCQASQCPPIPLVGNADVYSSHQGAAQSVTVVCHRGHRFPEGMSKKTFSCSTTHGWTMRDTDYRCYRQTCSPIHLPNGNMNDTSIFYDTVTEIDCDAGFQFKDGGSRRSLLCDAPGVWRGNYCLCTAVTCSSVPVVPHASVVSGGGAGVIGYNQTVTYTCSQGMRFEDGTTQTSIRCLAQDTWDTTLSCAARCNAPPLVKDAEYVIPFSVDPGNVTTYRCRRGYRMAGSQSEANITCDANTLTWTNTIPICESTYCKAVDDLDHTYINTSQTVFDTPVSLWCEHGYTFTHLTSSSLYTSMVTSGLTSAAGSLTSRVTSMMSKCGTDGKWDPLIKPCQLSICTELPEVPYGIMHGVYGTYGDIITVTCLPGYWVHRDVMYVNMTCGADGSWQGAPEACEPITCPPLGTWEFYLTNTSSTSVGTLVNVTCMDESSASTALGWQVVLCGELGVWMDPDSGTHDVINCTEEYTPVVFEPVDAPASTPIGVFWVLMALVPIILIILGDTYPLTPHLKHSYINIRQCFSTNTYKF